MGLYRKRKSPYWWMSYIKDGEQFWESTRTSSRNAALRIWKKREAEIALGKFKVGWPGERIAFEEMCKEFEQSHFAAISKGTVAGYRAYLKHLKASFGGLMLARITTKLVEEYRDHRRQQPSIRYRGRTLKGATVNRELECLTCLLDLAVRREYIRENPARGVKHFNELRERPIKQMLTLEQENRILIAASPHLRVGIVLLVQTGGRTYTEGFQLRWDQIDWENRLIRFGNDVKTPGSSEPLPLTDLAFRVLRKWKDGLASDSQASKRAALSDLQLAACFLCSPKLGSTRRCDSTGDASHKPRDKASVSTRHGRTGSRSDGESESTGVRRKRFGQLGRFS